VFERDAVRSPFDWPARALGMIHVTGITAAKPFRCASINVIPSTGPVKLAV
jgi:hypothetical protein